ncbi:MAG TPA: hypothetical protein VLS88_10965 [Polyangiales bacterium]|nr:hypothetical protein [Polyangiales bacterium]
MLRVLRVSRLRDLCKATFYRIIAKMDIALLETLSKHDERSA